MHVQQPRPSETFSVPLDAPAGFLSLAEGALEETLAPIIRRALQPGKRSGPLGEWIRKQPALGGRLPDPGRPEDVDRAVQRIARQLCSHLLQGGSPGGDGAWAAGRQETWVGR